MRKDRLDTTGGSARHCFIPHLAADGSFRHNPAWLGISMWNKWKIIPAALLVCAIALHFYSRNSHSQPLQEAYYLTMIAAMLSLLTVFVLERRTRWTWIGLIPLCAGWIWVAYEITLTLVALPG